MRVTEAQLALWARNRHLLALVERSTHGTRKLSTAKLLDFTIPLPSREEQEMIVVELHAAEEELREQLDEVARATDEARSALRGLAPVLLEQRFGAAG
jgi:restriction endonuclease S subunit